MSPSRLSRLPLTYAESRERFRRAVSLAGSSLEPHYISAPGRDGLRLSIDVVSVGSPRPSRGLIVMSGVHGLEGFIGSALQTDFLDRIDPESLPDGTGVLLIHAVNPWGMDFWRRQNESNVDLNRNWRRSETPPPANDGYEELHEHLCPDAERGPDVAKLVEIMQGYVNEHGLMWVLEAISNGQYSHPDGMHYGGVRTEESNLIVEEVVSGWLPGVEAAFTIDLHTGHGDYGSYTLLSDQSPGSGQDMWLRSHFGDDCVEATKGNPGATTSLKHGQIANGFRKIAGAAEYYSTSVEFGTADPVEQLTASYLEGFHFRSGQRESPGGVAAVWRYRCCFTPDDPTWESGAMAQGRVLLDKGLAAISGQ